jgi:hypothetical protein
MVDDKNKNDWSYCNFSTIYNIYENCVYDNTINIYKNFTNNIIL